MSLLPCVSTLQSVTFHFISMTRLTRPALTVPALDLTLHLDQNLHPKYNT